MKNTFCNDTSDNFHTKFTTLTYESGKFNMKNILCNDTSGNFRIKFTTCKRRSTKYRSWFDASSSGSDAGFSQIRISFPHFLSYICP